MQKDKIDEIESQMKQELGPPQDDDVAESIHIVGMQHGITDLASNVTLISHDGQKRTIEGDSKTKKAAVTPSKLEKNEIS